MRNLFSNDNDKAEPDKVFSAFARRRVAVFDTDEGEIERVELLLPIATSTNDVLKQRQELAQLQLDLHRATLQKEAELKALEVKPMAPLSSAPLSGASPSSKKLIVDEERFALQYQFGDDELRFASPGSTPSIHVPVYAYDEPIKLLTSGVTPDKDLIARNESLFKQLKKLGNFRGLAAGGSSLDELCDALKVLRHQQPHFGEVITVIEHEIALAKRRNASLVFQPMLFLGDPGVGKTHFTQELAKVLNRPMSRLGFDSSHTTSALLGSAKNWANTHPGIVFEMVCLSDRADPVILLDEIDKARDYNYQSPLASLHTLLEPVTSKKVADISVGMEFDASHVLWIATANEGHAIPAPLRSRFLEFHIEAPTGAQALQLARGVAQSFHAGMKLADFEPPADRLVVLLAHLTPREQIQSLKQAYASAVASGRNCLHAHDLPSEVFIDGSDDPAGNPTLFH
jgi:ATP-dependent Lon protease